MTPVLLPLRHAHIWATLGGVLLAVILVLALLPDPGQLPLSYNDKVAHALAFMALMIWFSGVVELRRLPMLALCLAAYGVLIELLQGLTPYRAVEVADVVADCAGIGIGWVLANAGLHQWAGRIEALLGVRGDGR